MPSAQALTADYEHWLRAQIEVVEADLRRKHQEMAHDEYRFFRGTYYLWLAAAARHTPEAFGHRAVPLVGDLHVENYGTWRDRDGVRRWGVNDLDELARGSWLLDPLRLAASAVLAPHVALHEHEICEQVLSAWYAAEPAAAVDLRQAPHLATLVPEPSGRQEFYAALAAGQRVDDVPDAVVAAAERVAEPGWHPTWHVHEAGTGSLGHRRRVGVGDAADGTTHAREAKELGRPTCVWAAEQGWPVSLPTPDGTTYDAVVAAVRGPAGAARADGWQVRDLAPDVVRIRPQGLRRRESLRLLEAMARAAVDVHGADRAAWAAAREEQVSEHDFTRLVEALVEVMRADFAAHAG